MTERLQGRQFMVPGGRRHGVASRTGNLNEPCATMREGET